MLEEKEDLIPRSDDPEEAMLLGKDNDSFDDVMHVINSQEAFKQKQCNGDIWFLSYFSLDAQN